MDPYYTRQFTPHRMDESAVQAYRQHEGDDYPADDDQPLTGLDLVGFWCIVLGPLLSVGAAVCMVIFWPGN